MRAVVISKPGGPEVLRIVEVAEPRAAPNEVVIRVHTTALNRADLLQREGRYPPPPGAPPYPGLEAAGTILHVGDGVVGWQPGDRVMALVGGGGHAEQLAVPQACIMPIPDSLDWDHAAALPEAWLTAYSNMMQIGRLAAGESVLIHAGGSGVGSAAIQLARWCGARVFSTASEGKLAQIKALGADVVIDYKRESFAERIEHLTNNRGVDLIVDFIGAPYWAENLRSLALWGRLVLVGLMGGREVEVNLGLFLAKKLSVHGSTLRDRTTEQKEQLVRDFMAEVWPALADGTLQPIVDSRKFRLDEVVEAHRYMEANQNFGKIILHVAEG